VAAAARDPASLDATVAEADKAGGTAVPAACDVRDEASVAALAACAAELGPVRAVVANAGVAGPTRPLHEQTLAGWRDTVATGLDGVFLTFRAFIPAMIARRDGSLIAISSMTGKRPLPGRTPYAAAKMGVIGLVRTLATELGPHGIRVNAVCPGAVAGPRIDQVLRLQAAARGLTEDQVRAEMTASSPLGRLVRAEEVAAACVCSSPPRRRPGSPARTSTSRPASSCTRQAPGGRTAMRIVDLSQDIYEGMKVYPGHLKTVQFEHATHEETAPRFEGGFSFQTTGFILNDNGPTHVDSFSHLDPDPAADSIEKMPLRLFYGTAVCLDVTGFPPRADITAGDLDRAEKASPVEVRPGDIVLFHTATWNRYAGDKRYLSEFAGLGESASEWIGEPGGTAPWGWRFGGHHVSLHNLITGGAVRAVTPCFLGADPAVSPLLGPAPLRPLGGAEDLARELMRSLGPEAAAQATLLNRAPSDIIGGNRVRLADGDEMIRLPDLWDRPFTEPRLAGAVTELASANETATGYGTGDHTRLALSGTPKGLPARELTGGQRGLLRALLAAYLGRVPDGLSPLPGYDDDGALDAVHLAWAGPLAAGQPHYYRLQGPGLLIEYDNVQRRANHAHSVWRNPQSDFGLDALAAHRAAHH